MRRPALIVDGVKPIRSVSSALTSLTCRQPYRHRRLQDRGADLVLGVGDGDAERPARAARLAPAEAVVFDRAVRGQRVRPRPAGIAARGQAVPVGGRAPRPHHPVDRRRPAEHPAAQPDLGCARRRDRAGEVPVQVTVAAQRVVEPLRDVEQRVNRPAAVLDEQHARALARPRPAAPPPRTRPPRPRRRCSRTPRELSSPTTVTVRRPESAAAVREKRSLNLSERERLTAARSD